MVAAVASPLVNSVRNYDADLLIADPIAAYRTVAFSA